MESLVTLLTTLSTFSPLAIIGLLGTVIYMLVQNQKDAHAKYETVTGNHLHELPAMADALRKIDETLQRIERTMAENFSEIRTRLR